MLREDPQTLEIWYDLMVNNKLLASIRGLKSAEWFLHHMSSGTTTDKYSLVRRGTNTDIFIQDIEVAKPW